MKRPRRAPDRPSPVRVPLLVLRGALGASVLIFVPGLWDQFEPPKAEVVRVCGLAMLAWVVASGRRVWHGWQPLDWAVAGWLAVEVLTTAMSAAPAISLLGAPMQREGLLTSLGLAGLYAAARVAGAVAGGAAASLDTVLVAAGLASVYALAQAAGFDPAPWHDAATYGAYHAYRRPFATLGHPNLLGAVVAATLAIAIARARGSGARRLGWGLAGAGLALAALLTLSRGAWLAALAGAAVVIVLAGRADDARRVSWRGWFLAGCAVAVIGIVVAAALGVPVTSRVAELLSIGGSGGARLEIWRSAVAAWRERPFLGYGPDTFELVYPRHQTAGYWRIEWGLQPFHAHSIALHTLATRGALGLIAGGAWLASLLLALRAAWRAGGERRALVPPLAGLLVALGVAGAFGAIGLSGALLICTASGLLAGAAAGGNAPMERPKRPAPIVAAVVVAALTLARGLVELSAAWAAGEAREAMASSPRAAAVSARRAMALAPLDDLYPRMLAEALERAASQGPDRATLLAEAETAARRSVSLCPTRSLNHRRLGSVLAGQLQPGDSIGGEGARAAFARAAELAPADGVAWMELARLELYLERPRAALAPARQAIALYPRVARASLMLARARLALADSTGARADLERAMPLDWQGRDDERRDADRLLERLRTPAPRPAVPLVGATRDP